PAPAGAAGQLGAQHPARPAGQAAAAARRDAELPRRARPHRTREGDRPGDPHRSALQSAAQDRGQVDAMDRDYFERDIRPLLDLPGVDFIGEISDREKSDFLSGAMALLMPIDWPEPFGLVMIEAMACGTPVIAYKSGSVPEIVEEGLTGFIVKDEVAAADAIINRLHKLERRRIRTRFEERFTARRMANDYLEVYR